MFWRVASIQHTSAVEAILDKGVGSFTLEELLEEDDLIQVSFSLQQQDLQKKQAGVDVYTCACRHQFTHSSSMPQLAGLAPYTHR